MNRRRFLAALGALAVAGKAAPEILAKLQPAPAAYDPALFGMGDVVVFANGYGLSGLTGSAWDRWQCEDVAVINPSTCTLRGLGTIVDARDGGLTIEWGRG